MGKESSKKMGSLASEILTNKNSSGIAKSLAGSVLSQAGTKSVTSEEMSTKASKVLNSSKYSTKTKSLAGSVLSQSKKN